MCTSLYSLTLDFRSFFFLMIRLFFFNDTATTEIYTLSLHDALPISIQSNHVVAESHKGHVDGFDPAEQVRINGARQDNSVNQTMFLQYGRQVDLLRRGSRGIMQHRKQIGRAHV